ncbi:hypothetical protein TGRH88_027710 [Toxoplasma gondii]|uniref:Uncharacterized protein n=1 Tax=Toxoplasma gondii TaxID=5811 RepID=A0A7J6K806_TOXGO|nr:hypothetical protein TGRH88_027710 [Toxoplasma gondii]
MLACPFLVLSLHQALCRLFLFRLLLLPSRLRSLPLPAPLLRQHLPWGSVGEAPEQEAEGLSKETEVEKKETQEGRRDARSKDEEVKETLREQRQKMKKAMLEEKEKMDEEAKMEEEAKMDEEAKMEEEAKMDEEAKMEEEKQKERKKNEVEEEGEETSQAFQGVLEEKRTSNGDWLVRTMQRRKETNTAFARFGGEQEEAAVTPGPTHALVVN